MGAFGGGVRDGAFTGALAGACAGGGTMTEIAYTKLLNFGKNQSLIKHKSNKYVDWISLLGSLNS